MYILNSFAYRNFIYPQIIMILCNNANVYTYIDIDLDLYKMFVYFQNPQC